ncbi:MAG: hypothetical protein AAF441_18400 [Pseudomonadota bacterium]
MFRRTVTTPASSRFRSVLLAAAVIASAVSATEARMISKMEVGKWAGSAHVNDETGAFSHCVFTRRYPGGMRLLFAVSSAKTWSFGFANENWNLKRGQNYAIRYRVDNEDVRSGTAHVKSKYLAQVRLPMEKRLVTWLMDGESFYLKTASSTYRFELGRSKRMLKKLFACAKENIQRASATPGTDEFEAESTPTFEPEPASAPRDERLPQTRKEGRTAVNYMLKQAGITGEAVTRKEQPQLVAGNDVVWKMNGMLGAFRILADRSLTPKKIARQIRASDVGVCSGQFSADLVSEPSRAAVDFMSVCDLVKGKKTANSLSVYYLVLPRREGGHYLMSIMGNSGSAERVRAMGLHLRAAAVALNAKGSVPGARPIS